MAVWQDSEYVSDVFQLEEKVRSVYFSRYFAIPQKRHQDLFTAFLGKWNENLKYLTLKVVSNINSLNANPQNCLNVFYHSVGLALKGLIYPISDY